MAVFNDAAIKTLSAAAIVCGQRGDEYQDSWALENMVTTFFDSTLRRCGLKMGGELKRLLILAALIDVKDSRMIGPWKNDSVLDGINYRAAYATLRDEFEAKYAPPVGGDLEAEVDANSQPPADGEQAASVENDKVISLDAERQKRADAAEAAATAFAQALIPCPYCQTAFIVSAGHVCEHPKFGKCAFEGVIGSTDGDKALILGWRAGDEHQETMVGIGRPPEDTTPPAAI